MKIAYIPKNGGEMKEVEIRKEDLAKLAILSVSADQVLTMNLYAGTITDSLQPVIDMLKDLADPVCYGFMLKGFMKVMSGDEGGGLKTVKQAFAGYMGVQWIPQIFKLLRSVQF